MASPRLVISACSSTLCSTQIALDLCLTSNVALRVVPDLDHHPIRELVARGVTVTINTDDPPMFGTDLNTEYAIAARLLDLDERGVTELGHWRLSTHLLPARKARLRYVPRSAPTPRRQLLDRYARA